MNAIIPRRLAGRCANGAERDGGSIYHGISGNSLVAVCGAEPGRRSAGWSTNAGPAITCPKCLRKLSKSAQPPYATLDPFTRCQFEIADALRRLDDATEHSGEHGARTSHGGWQWITRRDGETEKVHPWLVVSALADAERAAKLFAGITEACR